MAKLARQEILDALTEWMEAWNQHDLEGVMTLFHKDVVFEHWTGSRIRGKKALRRAWSPWFADHKDFRFDVRDLFVDKDAQKALLMWTLDWPCPSNGQNGDRERREGVDVLNFSEGKIVQKATFSKTRIRIGDRVTLLEPQQHQEP